MNEFIIFSKTIFEAKLPVEILSGIFGGFIGLLLVEIWDLIKRPKVQFSGFKSTKVNFGTLHKLNFRIHGKQHPGICQLEIQWNSKSVKAKWDETPNPLENDDLNKFKPELVPATFYQPLFLEKDYFVPIIHEDDEKQLSIFSGWWFGRKFGYGPDPKIDKKQKIVLTLSGNNFEWKKEFFIEDILKTTKS